jgi:hypothetical protein
MSLTRRPEPEPNRPFVDRETELKLIDDKLREGCKLENKIPLAVTCFWGANGVGKSWFLQELERQYRRDGSHSTDSCRTIAVRLKLDKSEGVFWKDNKFTLPQIIPELWKQLARQMGAPMPSLQGLTPEQVAKQFAEQVSRWANYVTPIILLDAVDDLVYADEASFFWLEEHLIERLAMTDRVLFVLASRGELRRWRRFQVSRRVDLVPLQAFGEAKKAGEQVKASEPVGQILYSHAFGHPWATDQLADILVEKGVNLERATVAQTQDALDPESVKKVLHEITHTILEKIPKELELFAKAICILRWVNVEPIQHLAEKLELVEDKPGDAYYLDVIGKLQANHLLYWDIQTSSYLCDPAVRRLIAHTLELEDRELFTCAHAAAREFHQVHLKHYPDYLARYVPEVAYHTATLPQDAPPTQTFRAWWDTFLTNAPQHPDPWQELSDALWNPQTDTPTDKELYEILGHTEYVWLVEQAQTHAR